MPSENVKAMVVTKGAGLPPTTQGLYLRCFAASRAATLKTLLPFSQLAAVTVPNTETVISTCTVS